MATPKRRSPPSPTTAEAIKEHFKKPRSTSPGPASPLEQEPINRLSNVQGASCVHDVSYPENYQAQPNQLVWSSPKPAREYPFTLDPFQQEAVRCLEAGESVLVSAHTSAGKTVVAEYAIAMSLKNNQRVVYTSPIKALSNQKFRELAEEFSDVGLMTGDVTISPNASCLVMTTEILRSMQYRGSEIMREVAWIIFDEVHYMRDRERGVVWEESIVMAPKNARFVFLSATVPNAKEFADWVAKVHQQPCHIVYTDFRPTPLQHLIFPSGADGLYVVVDEKGTFRDDNFQKAMNAVSVNVADHTGKRDNGKWRRGLNIKNGESSDIFKIVQMIMQNNYSPAIVFSFSKRDCENLAVQMLKLDLNDENEKELVEGIFWNAMDSLSDDDKKLPQVSQLLPHLKRGIGVHHSGLLPILKEVIEILFQEGLIKCLFATETFSIGLNMPAKTVVFTSVRKFDGTKFRVITSGEYIQMSGRAGRRGLDAIGTCILMVDEKLEPAAAKSIVKGAADPLNSAFHLSYNMILNQMRCEESNPENLLKQSFYQFQCDRGLPTLKERIKDLEEERDSISIEDEEKVVEYNKMLKQIQELKSDIRNIVFSPRHCIPFFQPGRLVRIMRSCNGDEEYQKLLEHEPAIWGVIVNFEKVSEAVEEEDNDKKVQQFKVDVLVQCLPDKNNNRKVVKIVPFNEPGEPIVTALPLTQLQSLSAVRVLIPKDLRPIEQRERMIKAADEALRRCPQMLDPIDDMKIQSNSYEKYTRRLESLEALLEKHPLSSSPTLNYRLKALDIKKALTASIRAARGSIRSASALAFKEELKARKRVLRRLQYTTSDDIVELKGRIACEITSADELVITELFFSGVLKEASTEQLAALLSCFVWQEKVKGSKKLSEELSGLYSQLKDTARKIGKVQDECKISTDIEEYVNSFRPDIMELVYAWCKGSSFLEIMKMAEVFEGSLVRALRRLEELLQELIVVTKSIGDQDMEAKFQDTVVKIKRDIVFAASLYL